MGIIPDAGNTLTDHARQLFEAIFTKTKGNASSQFSMYTIGMELGLSKDESRIASENLMGENLIDIRSLSGSIGLTQDGVEFGMEHLEGKSVKGNRTGPLTREKILDENGVKSLEVAIIQLKAGFGAMGLSFESASEFMADVRSAEAQLASPKPKTAIIREALCSIRDLVKKHAPKTPSLDTISTLLG